MKKALFSFLLDSKHPLARGGGGEGECVDTAGSMGYSPVELTRCTIRQIEAISLSLSPFCFLVCVVRKKM